MADFQPTTLREAAAEAATSISTVKGWCERYGIGRLVDGRWHISPSGLARCIAVRKAQDLLSAERAALRSGHDPR